MEFAMTTLDEAIEAHTVWTTKFATYLRHCDGHLTAGEVRAHSRCAIGQWLHREGRLYYGLPEYEAAMAEHVRFHSIAADIVERANVGENVCADHILGSDSEFGLAERKVLKSAQELRKIVGALSCEHGRAANRGWDAIAE
jgi:hypothetical protein